MKSPGKKAESEDSISTATALASPSLAMVKYWGKIDTKKNIPATPSLALTLGGLETETRVELITNSQSKENDDRVYIRQNIQDKQRFTAFFESLRHYHAKYRREHEAEQRDYSFHVYSESNFPTAAGLASSASGFAALTLAATKALGLNPTKSDLSSLARIGSASAARSVWGGFVRLDAGAEEAVAVYDENWWPELRVVIVQTSDSVKKISSRKAMELTRETSPFYPAWIKDAPYLMDRALDALKNRDLASLGPVMRSSYMRMFSTMFACETPIIYWNSTSLDVIKCCETLRYNGLSAWETMDAGPQVKIFCMNTDLDDILTGLDGINGIKTIVAIPGRDARILS